VNAAVSIVNNFPYFPELDLSDGPARLGTVILCSMQYASKLVAGFYFTWPTDWCLRLR
jgi:hypothetical protein